MDFHFNRSSRICQSGFLFFPQILMPKIRGFPRIFLYHCAQCSIAAVIFRVFYRLPPGKEAGLPGRREHPRQGAKGRSTGVAENRNPSLPLMRGSTCVEGSRNPSLPLTREVARRAGGRENFSIFPKFPANTELSLPQSTPLTAPSSEGAERWAPKICIVSGGQRVGV